MKFQTSDQKSSLNIEITFKLSDLIWPARAYFCISKFFTCSCTATPNFNDDVRFGLSIHKQFLYQLCKCLSIVYTLAIKRNTKLAALSLFNLAWNYCFCLHNNFWTNFDWLGFGFKIKLITMKCFHKLNRHEIKSENKSFEVDLSDVEHA